MRSGRNVNETNMSSDKKNNFKGNGKKIVIKNKSKFFVFIGIALVIVIVVVCLIVSNIKIKIDEDTNISELNAEKYSEEIKQQYELEGKDSEFMEDWNEIQDATARYLIENYPADYEQVSVLMNEISEVLKSDNWEKLNMQKNVVWNGTWSMDENGRVSFKFANKEIEPSWSSTLSDQGYVILN